ncbi:hypothetical protein [Dyella sp. 20L07]|uniref:hypothetical protein n=1 Tax=Dyella sp. 20L07 TaxID=3384240 RepID=UPI003D2DF10D
MQRTPPMDTAEVDGDMTEITQPPATTRHPPGHGLVDNLDIAAHDEVEHEAALRDSSLRVPR